MKQIVTIPCADIKRIQIYINRSAKTLAEIKAKTGADYIINGGVYSGTRAVMHLRADGYTWAEDPYSYWGYAWDVGPDIGMGLVPCVKANYINCTELIRGGAPNPKPAYNADMGGRRGRTAMGLMGGKLGLYVSSDGSSDAETPEQLRDELAALGWESALMMDGGGSSQCDFQGRRITSTRKVHNLILIYLKKREEKPVEKKHTVCLDPGHGPDTVNGSPDGTYKEREFAWDLYRRLRPLLEGQGINVVCTRTEGTKPSLTARCEVSNKAGADIFVSLHTNADGGNGWGSSRGLLVYTSSGPETAVRNVAAKAILARMQEAGVSIKGTGLLHQIEYTVLSKTKAPAVLIEYGFHTNREDTALLKNGAYRDKLAEATAKGICDFLGVAWAEIAETEPWYTQDQKWAVELGLSDGTRPEDNCTRAEVWAMLRRLDQRK